MPPLHAALEDPLQEGEGLADGRHADAVLGELARRSATFSGVNERSLWSPKPRDDVDVEDGGVGFAGRAPEVGTACRRHHSWVECPHFDGHLRAGSVVAWLEDVQRVESSRAAAVSAGVSS